MIEVKICKHGIKDENGILKTIKSFNIVDYKNYQAPNGWTISSISFFTAVKPSVTIYLSKKER